MRQMMHVLLCAFTFGINARLNPGTRDELLRLGESYFKHPIHPIIASHEYAVWDGWRRVLGMRLLLGEKSEHPVETLVTNEKLDDAGIVEVNLVTAIHRRTLTGWEQLQACLKLLEAHPEWAAKDLAAFLNLDPSRITKILSATKLGPDWLEALRDGRVTTTDCHRASMASELAQQEMLAAKINGASLAEVETAGRKVRSGCDKPAVKTNCLRCPLPSGVTVTISGTGLTLDDGFQAIGELQKEMKKGVDSGLDTRTFQALLRCRDKAKKEVSHE